MHTAQFWLKLSSWLLLILIGWSCNHDEFNEGSMKKVSEKGKAFIKAREGCKLYSYPDGSLWTIGWGNTRYEDGTPVRPGDRITQARADKLFAYWVDVFAKDVAEITTNKTNQSQFDALVSYAYNRGIGKYRSSKLLKMVNANPNNPAIAQQFVLEWGTTTKYKNGLIKRRKQEAELYFSQSANVPSGTFNWLYLLVAIIVVILFYQYNKHKQWIKQNLSN